MKKLKFTLLSSLLFTLALTGLAQTRLGPKDGETLPPADLNRLKLGEEAPDFTLEAQDGKPVTLSSYRNHKTIVLVFYRGYW